MENNHASNREINPDKEISNSEANPKSMDPSSDDDEAGSESDVLSKTTASANASVGACKSENEQDLVKSLPTSTDDKSVETHTPENKSTRQPPREAKAHNKHEAANEEVSLDSLEKDLKCFCGITSDMVVKISECKKSLEENEELFGLVEKYLFNTAETLKFCNALTACIDRARDGLLIAIALQQFEEEDDVGGTLKWLNKFTAAGNPFTEFIEQPKQKGDQLLDANEKDKSDPRKILPKGQEKKKNDPRKILPDDHEKKNKSDSRKILPDDQEKNKKSDYRRSLPHDQEKKKNDSRKILPDDHEKNNKSNSRKILPYDDDDKKDKNDLGKILWRAICSFAGLLLNKPSNSMDSNVIPLKGKYEEIQKFEEKFKTCVYEYTDGIIKDWGKTQKLIQGLESDFTEEEAAKKSIEEVITAAKGLSEKVKGLEKLVDECYQKVIEARDKVLTRE